MSDEAFYHSACQHCGQPIEFPAEGRGMHVACPHCENQTLLEESNLESFPAKNEEEIPAAELREALSGFIPPRRVSVLYQLALLVVAGFMILLPLAYVGF